MKIRIKHIARLKISSFSCDQKFNVSFLPFLLDGVALNPELNLKDGKHPNAEGINLISKNLEKKLINLLRN